MSTHKHSPTRIAVSAALLLLAVSASSCGSLPTAPAVDSGASLEHSSRNAGIQSAGDQVVVDDFTPPAGGPDMTNQPPAGETPVPTPGLLYKGTKTGWWNNPNRRHNH